MQKLAQLYDIRFNAEERAAKDKIWRALCEGYFQRFIAPGDALLEMACGYGEFSRHIVAGRKVAVDLNPDSRRHLPGDVEFYLSSAESMPMVASSSIDVAFASNFFEHLPSKSAMDAVLQEVHRVLKPGGRFVMMQPNIKYCSKSYWDFYDHHLPLSHLSAAEGLEKNDFQLDVVVPRFVPFSTKSAYPKYPWLIRHLSRTSYRMATIRQTICYRCPKVTPSLRLQIFTRHLPISSLNDKHCSVHSQKSMSCAYYEE